MAHVTSLIGRNRVEAIIMCWNFAAETAMAAATAAMLAVAATAAAAAALAMV